jgi:hypothetical protein
VPLTAHGPLSAARQHVTVRRPAALSKEESSSIRKVMQLLKSKQDKLMQHSTLCSRKSFMIQEVKMSRGCSGGKVRMLVK